MKLFKFLKNLALYALGKIKPLNVKVYEVDHKTVENVLLGNSTAKEEYLKQFPENPVKVRNAQVSLCTEPNDYGEKNKEKIQKIREMLAKRTGPKPDLLATIRKNKA